jgi:hypothetical protein
MQEQIRQRMIDDPLGLFTDFQNAVSTNIQQQIRREIQQTNEMTRIQNKFHADYKDLAQYENWVGAEFNKAMAESRGAISADAALDKAVKTVKDGLSALKANAAAAATQKPAPPGNVAVEQGAGTTPPAEPKMTVPGTTDDNAAYMAQRRALYWRGKTPGTGHTP